MFVFKMIISLSRLEEAEAQCALLNSASLCVSRLGYVYIIKQADHWIYNGSYRFQDGCFSSDSDIFLFGAKTVYRDIILGDLYSFKHMILEIYTHLILLWPLIILFLLQWFFLSHDLIWLHTSMYLFWEARWGWLCIMLWDGRYREKAWVWKEFTGKQDYLASIWLMFDSLNSEHFL